MVNFKYSQISKKVEADTLKRKITSKILQKAGAEEIINLVKKFKSCFI